MLLKKGIAISTALHVSIGAVVIYLIMTTHTPSKPKIIPVTIVTLPSTPKMEPSPPKPIQKPKAQKKLLPKKEIEKVLIPKSVAQETKPIFLPKLEPKQVEEKPQEILKTVTSIEPIEKPKKIESKISTVESKNIKSKYLGTIYQNINRLKIYPKSAQKLGQSGTVYVTFTILADGRISDVLLSKTSEFTILDNAAQKILITLAKVAPIPKELKEQSMTITIPINYIIE